MLMKNGVFSTLLLLMFLNLGCTKDVDDESSILGSWVETAPVEGRTKLFFAQDNTLHLWKAEGTLDVFDYKIEGNSLFLKLHKTQDVSSELFIDLIEQNKLKVENLYPSIPEQEPTFIIFTRN